jgi:hypothetical protein
VQSDGGMRVSASIENDSIECETDFVQLINKFTFDVRLIIMQLNRRKTFLKLLKKSLKRFVSINRSFAFAKEVEIRAVDDLNFHVKVLAVVFDVLKLGMHSS